MLEGLVAWVLNNYLGKYVENLNTDQLSIAILSGEVELENLPLRRDALRYLGIPIEIRAGHIGKVKLQIPIRSLRSSPWVIIIERLYLVAGPLSLDDWDQSAEDLADQERKLTALDAIEACWRLEADSSISGGTSSTSSHYASSYSSWLSYGTGVITDIMENMQLHVKDVHIRYEDPISLASDSACVCGFTIESLSAQSCDQNWIPHFTTTCDGSDLSFKTIELKNLAVYWDKVNPTCELTSKLPPAELASVLGDSKSENHHYLVAPVSACAKLQRNRSELPLRSVNTPRIICELNLDQVPLSLIDWQYEQMVCCIRGLEFLSRVQQYRRRRPSVSVLQDPRAWWVYACESHISGSLRRTSTWEEALERAKENVQYVELYTKLLAQPSATLGFEVKRLKDAMEWSRDFEELRALRECAMRRVPYPVIPPSSPISSSDPPLGPEGTSSGRSVLVRWFPQWWGWYSTSDTSTPSSEVFSSQNTVPQVASSPTGGSRQLEDEILEALADSAKNNTLLRRDVVFGRFNFTLNGGKLELCASTEIGTQGVTMLELQFSELVAEIVSKPRSASFSVELRLGALFLRDCLTQGTLFPILVGPPTETSNLSRGQFGNRNIWTGTQQTSESPFFIFTYSCVSNSLRRLHVTSRPLDVVYQPAAVRWLLEFACAPHQRSAARHRLEEMRARTRQQLTDTWGSMLEGKDNEPRHRSWDLSLDVSAPQLILVERFCDPLAAIAVVDLGTLRLKNGVQMPQIAQKPFSKIEEDDDEAFMTPCSTPPGSETEEDSQTLVTALSELSLHQRLYDTYNIELSDIQVLVGRVKDNWRQAHTKGSSSMHVLDRFNIALTVERRIVPTADPMYPSVSLCANLPRLVAHINEQKIFAVRIIAKVISETSLPSPFCTGSPTHESQNVEAFDVSEASEATTFGEEDSGAEPSKLLTVQFTVDQMSLEVQSRGRCVAELQVSGVTASLARRPADLSISLTVLGLLLVDALQTFGSDFELLVASHRHVGMDSMSGSLRDSEPTSPTSPRSPDTNAMASKLATSPIALNKALTAVVSQPPGAVVAPAETLISVEFILVTEGDEPLQFASIQFNSLDIIANQETIVELMGFIRRVFPSGARSIRSTPILPPQVSLDEDKRIRSRTTSRSDNLEDGSGEALPPSSRTELTFDFHRLNVLLFRASIEDGKTVGRKIGTATMSEAKIQATVDSTLFVRGSLGGLQVLDLTPEGYLHQKIISVGKDPLAEDSLIYRPEIDLVEKAFSFSVRRNLQPVVDGPEPVMVSVRMASVWYTHSSQFLAELQSCATEFKNYLSDAARSIRSAATDVALGLVHARTSLVAYDVNSPRRLRRRSTSSEPYTPYIPQGDEDGFDDASEFDTTIRLDVILNSPVLVLPRSADSCHVLVAHLGKITISNITSGGEFNTSSDSESYEHLSENNVNNSVQTYTVEVRDMNISTLDTEGRRVGPPGGSFPRVDHLYNCQNAIPVLHDTLLKLQVTKYPNVEGVDLGGPPLSASHGDDIAEGTGLLKVNGCVMNALRVSLTRGQYEQVLDTLQWLGKDDGAHQPSATLGGGIPMGVIAEEDVGGVSSVNMDSDRTKFFPTTTRLVTRATSSLNSNQISGPEQSQISGHMNLYVRFEVATFEVEICDREGSELVGLTFGEFLFTWRTPKKYETELQVSLKSLLVEDLLREKGVLGRQMIASRDDGDTFTETLPFLSHSCPNTSIFHPNVPHYGSLPDRLDTKQIYGMFSNKVGPHLRATHTSKGRGHELVLITSKIVDTNAPNFNTDYESMRKVTTVDLGSIAVVVSAKSWIPLLDFFSISNQDEETNKQTPLTTNTEEKIGNSSTVVTIRSLSLQALRSSPSTCLAQGKVTGAHLDITSNLNRRQIQGRLSSLQIRHSIDELHACQGERFVTIGNRALDFRYSCPPESETEGADSELTLKISPFVYVHTRKFIAELRAFFGDFSRPINAHSVRKSFKRKSAFSSYHLTPEVPSRMSLKLSADACVMLVPVKPASKDILVLDVGSLTADNIFIQTNLNKSESDVINLDVTKWRLTDVDVYAAKTFERDIVLMNTKRETTLVFGDCTIERKPTSLLANKCLLELRVDRNVLPNRNHRRNGVADMTINCRLSTLELSLEQTDYALIHGVLTYNLGEDTEHIQPSLNVSSTNTDDVWTVSSLRIELLDVKVHLRPLACINFVRSRLTIDNFSDLSQDIDLVSRQILINDERVDKTNVFNIILKPVTRGSTDGSVQAEVHSRKRRENSKFTVLLNNMRLMAIPDWWKLAGDFIFTKYQPTNVEIPQNVHQNNVSFELKLNITESEIVVVEDDSKNDSSAVILRSTTLITYKPNSDDSSEIDKPLSCSVNHLELFSCKFLGSDDDADEDTALSIIDPVTISAEITGNCLEIHLQELIIRVSYRDILLFAAILDSFTKQTSVASCNTTAANPTGAPHQNVTKLSALGFSIADCEAALEVCNQRLDDAALWLTQHATPRALPQRVPQTLDIKTVELKANVFRICLIDDCGDVDVPLAEATLGGLVLGYVLGGGDVNHAKNNAAEIVLVDKMDLKNSKSANIDCCLNIDYYNRVLGGWEPFLEAWHCEAIWKPEVGLTNTRHHIALHSKDLLNVNVTDSSLALIRLVRDSWTMDIGTPRATPRVPFVPYSLKNDTGSSLYFATVISDPDEPVCSLDDFDCGLWMENNRYRNLKWIEVPVNAIVPFRYAPIRSKQRHADSHQLRSHQLCVRVFGWQPCAPVTVDRVGVYFRSVAPDRTTEPHRITAPRSTRLVFNITLDGSARKLITVRGSMILINKLHDPVDVKLVERSAVNAVSTSSRTALLPPNTSHPVSLVHSYSLIFIRPSNEFESYSYSQPDVPWSRVLRPGDRELYPLRCTTNRGTSYFVCCEIRRERYPLGGVGHTILLLPALLLVNLLPQDLHFSITSISGVNTSVNICKGRVPPGQNLSIPSADPDNSLEISFFLDNFRCTSGVVLSNSMSTSANVDTFGGEYSTRVRLEDTERRSLILRARIELGRGARVRVTITAPYWIINRTGLPLVFRQEGVTVDTAGQFEEHELARMVAPLLFSFADQDASPTVVARVGHRYGANRQNQSNRQWCQQFHLRRGIQVRRFHVSQEEGPDLIYVVGIEVRGARGRRHQHTNIVIVSPRHELHNRSSRTLEFAQSYHTNSSVDPGSSACRVYAPPGCHMPFHWPRLDRDQLICIRCTNITTNPLKLNYTAWSGGLRIDSPSSCHILVRDAATGARFCFLHAEVVPQGATYSLVVSDAGDLPPPLRIDNCSEVAVMFGQWACSAGPTVAHARRAVPYAWDEPSGSNRMVITAPGGVSATFDVDRLGRGSQLTYKNFIYIAFTGTFNTEDDLDHYNESNYSSTSFPVTNCEVKVAADSGERNTSIRFQRLVLDVPEGSNSVVLARKQPGKRSQLWRMTSIGQLQHEESMEGGGGALVLDIEAPAPQPSAPRPAKLALRRADSRRRTTQTWRFAPDGRLCCAHRNTCVQAMDGLLGLRPGSAAVLGPIYNSPPYREAHQVPLEQFVGKQRMRPGSGLLTVEITTDGPTRVLRITDMKQRDPTGARACADDDDWQGVALAHRPKNEQELGLNQQQIELQIKVLLGAGLGVSLVGGARELLYLQLNKIIAEATVGPKSQELCISVQDAQCDNQLPDSAVPVLIYGARGRSTSEFKKGETPVLELRAEMSPSAGSVVIFKHFIVCVKPLAIHLEETLLLRIYEFFLTASGAILGPDDEDDGGNDDGTEANEENITGAATLAQTPLGVARRYHFGIIRLVPGPIRLSVHTAGSGLTPRLRSVKRRLGLTLVGFEDAPVELEPYVRHHPFETGDRLRSSVINHFREELLWQAAAILGSVDFLGSPLGLLGDVTEGVSGLIRERSVGALVFNVAHGISNSAAKVAETLGDGLGRVAMDDAHEEMRQRIRRRHAGSGGDHLVAGLKGLGFGLLGGATGIFKQVYEGAASDGLQGVFSGLGKGLVGAVAKPVVGVLDLATETARAVRDSSRGSSRLIPDRKRQPRATQGPGGLLPPYNPRDSRGQAYLRHLIISEETRHDLMSDAQVSNDFNLSEQFVAYECVRSGPDDLRVIVSKERVRVVTGGGILSDSGANLTVVTETGLGELVHCTSLTQDGRPYIEMTVRGTSLRRPLIRCDSEELARNITRQINYAKRLHEEATHTLPTQDD